MMAGLSRSAAACSAATSATARKDCRSSEADLRPLEFLLNKGRIVTERGGAAGRRRPAEPSHHPRPARLLDLDPGPKFSTKERKELNLSRFYAITQIEYCRNFIFKRNFLIHKLFERSCELGLWRLTAEKSLRSSAPV